MPIVQTKAGWQVVSIDGKSTLSDDDLTHEQAEKEEKEAKKRHPLSTWSRIRGKLEP